MYLVTTAAAAVVGHAVICSRGAVQTVQSAENGPCWSKGCRQFAFFVVVCATSHPQISKGKNPTLQLHSCTLGSLPFSELFPISFPFQVVPPPLPSLPLPLPPLSRSRLFVSQTYLRWWDLIWSGSRTPARRLGCSR